MANKASEPPILLVWLVALILYGSISGCISCCSIPGLENRIDRLEQHLKEQA